MAQSSVGKRSEVDLLAERAWFEETKHNAGAVVILVRTIESTIVSFDQRIQRRFEITRFQSWSEEVRGDSPRARDSDQLIESASCVEYAIPSASRRLVDRSSVHPIERRQQGERSRVIDSKSRST